MASYYTSFNYLDHNSAELGYIVTTFEPDDGFKDTFLDMDQISEDYYDGTKKFLYGTRYNSTATINITLIKMDGTDWSVNDNRKALKWLTGSRTASWLDLCKYKDDEKGWVSSYSFLGTVKSPQQYKLDGRVIGISFEFASITPWAYSAEQVFDRSLEQKLTIQDGVLIKIPENEISINDNGVLCNSRVPGVGACFCIDDDGVVYVENIITALIDNKTDDLYSYIYLDIEFDNKDCNSLEITNETLGETTSVSNIQPEDIINITNKQFIIAYKRDQNTGELENQNRIFGNDFNFIWPRLVPGENHFVIKGSANGDGTVKFIYRYPMKVGDCAMDISTYGNDAVCDCYENIPSYDTVRWQDITGTPTSMAGYGITDAYNREQVDSKIDSAVENKADKATTLSGYGIVDAYTIDEIDEKLQAIDVDIEWNDISNKPTTIAGYGITDAYTESEIDTKIEDVNTKIDNIEINGGTGTGGSITIDEDELNEMLEDILS